MSYIYVYTNKYFIENNSIKIGSTVNPYIRLNTYTTYYIDKGKFEYLFEINTDPYDIDYKIRTKYIIDLNTRNNGDLGGTEIYQNINIYERIIQCFINENIKWIEIDPTKPPLTKKYDDPEYKKIISAIKENKLEISEPFNFNIDHERISILTDTDNGGIEALNWFGDSLIDDINNILISSNKNKSLVRLNDKYTNNLEIRNSYSYNYTIDFKSFLGSDYNNDFKSLLKKITSKSNHKNIIWNNIDDYILLEYVKGGVFKKHCDKNINDNHYGTLLIFPPAKENFEHTGGDLIIYNLDGSKFIFESSKNKKWTFIAFHTYLQHECTEIISGRRIVLKKELLLKHPIKKIKELRSEFRD